MPDASTAIHLGNQTRELEVTPGSLKIARALLLKIGLDQDPRLALALNPNDYTVVTFCAAAALIKVMGDKASPERLDKWLEKEPAKFLELKKCTAEAYRRFYVSIGVIEDLDDDDDDEKEEAPPGEASGPETKA